MSYKIGELWLLVEGETKETTVFVILLVVLVLHSYESIELICRRFLSCIVKGEGSRITRDSFFSFCCITSFNHHACSNFFIVNVDYM